MPNRRAVALLELIIVGIAAVMGNPQITLRQYLLPGAAVPLFEGRGP